jgi:hypothetical protein
MVVEFVFVAVVLEVARLYSVLRRAKGRKICLSYKPLYAALGGHTGVFFLKITADACMEASKIDT